MTNDHIQDRLSVTNDLEELVSLFEAGKVVVADIEQGDLRERIWLEGLRRTLHEPKRRVSKQVRKKVKHWAHEAVARALEKGKLMRPDRCEQCGKPGRIEAHHRSYKPERWLDVEWLCLQCHRRETLRKKR